MLGLCASLLWLASVVLCFHNLDVCLGILSDFSLLERLGLIKSTVFVEDLEAHAVLWHEVELLTKPDLGTVVDVLNISILMDSDWQLLCVIGLILEDECDCEQVAVFLGRLR